MLIYFILLGEEVGGGGTKGCLLWRSHQTRGALKNVLYEGVPALPFYLPFLTEKVLLFNTFTNKKYCFHIPSFIELCIPSV